MKNQILVFLVFVILSDFMHGQIDGKSISLEIQQETTEQALKKIENLTGLTFYYLPKWLNTGLISKSYQDTDVRTILEDIFHGTELHFFELQNEGVYITKGRLIYDYLPDDFFGQSRDTLVGVFPRTQTSKLSVVLENSNTAKRQERQVVYIGKQSENTFSETFKLSGYIISSQTKDSIPNVLIRAGNNKSTVSDSNGYYEIELPFGENTIYADALGLERIEQPIVLYGQGTLNLELNEEVAALSEVVVSANVRESTDGTQTGKNAIDSEESKKIPVVLGERDLLKIATTLPGISSAGEASAGLNVRGGKSDQNLFLLDNSVIYNPSHFFGIFQALNPFVISSVDIYKGNIPSEFGGRLSSVFKVNTKKVNKKKISGEASIGPVTGNLMLDIPVVQEKSGLMIGGRGTYSDWILNAIDNEQLQGRRAYFYDVMGKYEHDFNENNSIEALAYYSKDAFSITKDSLFAYDNRLFSLQWNHKFNEKHQGTLKVSNSNYFFEIDFDGRPQIGFNYNFNIEETELKLKMRYLQSDRHSFTYGISSKLYTLDPGSITGNTDLSQVESLSIALERGLESAIFIADNFMISKKLQIDLGLRYSIFNAIGPSEQVIYRENEPKSQNSIVDRQSFDSGTFFKTYAYPEIRLGSRYFLAPDFSVKLGYSSATQYIHSLSSNTTISPIDTWKLSDINTKPQRAEIFSLGFYRLFESTKYEASLEGFYKKQHNILDFKVGAQLLLNEEIEQETLQGRGKSYGVELLFKKNTGRLTGWLGYTYSRSFFQLKSEFFEEQVNNGEFFPANFDKPHDVSLVSNYEITKRLSFSTNFVYQTGRPVTFATGTFFFDGKQQVLFSQRNKFRIPDYYRLDIGFNLEGNHKKKKLAHSFWSLSVYNLLGRNNPYSVFFVTDGGEIETFQSSIFNIPVPSLTYNLKF